MEMAHSLGYVSNVSPNFNLLDLVWLYDETVCKNYQADITGVLIFYEGMFFQVFEGEKSIIQSLFEKIKRDIQHKDLILLFNLPSTRIFNKYQKGFSIVNCKKELQNLNAYLASQDTSEPTSACITRMVKSFLRT